MWVNLRTYSRAKFTNLSHSAGLAALRNPSEINVCVLSRPRGRPPSTPHPALKSILFQVLSRSFTRFRSYHLHSHSPLQLASMPPLTSSLSGTFSRRSRLTVTSIDASRIFQGGFQRNLADSWLASCSVELTPRLTWEHWIYGNYNAAPYPAEFLWNTRQRLHVNVIAPSRSLSRPDAGAPSRSYIRNDYFLCKSMNEIRATGTYMPCAPVLSVYRAIAQPPIKTRTSR